MLAVALNLVVAIVQGFVILLQDVDAEEKLLIVVLVDVDLVGMLVVLLLKLDTFHLVLVMWLIVNPRCTFGQQIQFQLTLASLNIYQ